jgi:hypothetical protein
MGNLAGQKENLVHERAKSGAVPYRLIYSSRDLNARFIWRSYSNLAEK